MTYIEIAYAPKNEKTIIKTIDYHSNMTVKLAIELSGLLELYPEIVDCAVGIYKNLVTKDCILNPKDRVEIYRHLLVCPKERRRKRAN